MANEGNSEYQDPTRANADGSVNYTVKELLARVDLKIDGLYAHLDAKVDRAEFIQLKTEVEAFSTFKAKVYGAIAVIALIASAGFVHPFN